MKEEFIQFAPLFGGLSEDEQKIIGDGFEASTLSAGATLFEAGDASEALYLIGQGFVRLTTNSGATLATLGPGSVLGEDGLFRHGRHELTATAVSDLAYWFLSDRHLRDIVLNHPAIGIKLGQNFGSQIAQMQDYLVQTLGATPEFHGMPRHTLEAVAARLRAQTSANSDVLYHAGEPSRGLFLVEEGSVELQPDTANSVEESSTIGAGQLLGVTSLLTGKPYTNSAVADANAFLWTLSAEEFQALNSQHPGLRRQLSSSVNAPLSRPDQARAVMRLAQMPIFAELPPQTLQAIAQRMRLEHAAAGERVYRIGETGDAVYLIETGEVELAAENAAGILEELARIGPDGYFGELSLVSGQLRTEDATSTRHANLWTLHKTDLDALTQQYPAIGKALSAGLATRLSTAGANGGNLDHIRAFRLFADLDDAELSQIAQHLEPNRFRAGEQIFRASAPAEHLFLLEQGQIRIQPLSGGSWILGPGEAFGERALLSNQPHNSSAIAETDADVWTLSKEDFNLLLAAHPSLAINISRILSQRMGEQPGVPFQEYAGAGLGMAQSSSYAAARTVPLEDAGTTRRGPIRWFRDLDTLAKVQLIVLLLLLGYLLVVAAPMAMNRMLSGAGMATDPVAPSNSAIDAVYSIGSFQVAAMDDALAQAVALVDQQVPATPTYTPFPTSTPIPTATPTITPTPLPTNTPTPQPVVQQVAAAPVVQEAEPEPAVEAAAALPVAWDGRLDQLGINIVPANVQPGEQYWRVVEARFLNEKESGGKHHIYVDVLDENGTRVVGQPITVFWGDGSHTSNVEDKAPPDLGFNFQMYAAGYAYSVKVEGLPSEVVQGAGMGSIEDRFRGIHTSYEIVYAKTTK